MLVNLVPVGGEVRTWTLKAKKKTEEDLEEELEADK